MRFGLGWLANHGERLCSFVVERSGSGASGMRGWPNAPHLIQQVPGIVEPLRRGDLCLSSVIEAAKVVTPENWQTVLPRFFGLSRREAMEVVAELQPHPAPPERMVITPVRLARCSSEGQAVQRTSPGPEPLSLLDHIHPKSLGGASTAENVRIACKAHNNLAARLILGDELMDRYGSGLCGTARRPVTAGANDGAPAASPP